jgi:hypothetical protein
MVILLPPPPTELGLQVCTTMLSVPHPYSKEDFGFGVEGELERAGLDAEK